MNKLEYALTIEKWRQEREKNLSAPHGWLSTAGLYWLEKGENLIGADPNNPIKLLPGSAQDFCGIFIYQEGFVTLKALEGAEFFMQEKKLVEERIPVGDDTSPVILLNRLEIYVIRRGQRLGVRIFDPDNPAIKRFKGLNWFQINPEYRIEARYVPFSDPKEVEIINVLGDREDMVSPGVIEFTWQGEDYALEPVMREDGRFWILFSDATNRTLTYPAGRYLICDAPKDGQCVLDFNKAYNPPCAFTDFATCPIPPARNRLHFEVMAGEKRYIR